MKKSQAGFTIIELIIVILILGIIPWLVNVYKFTNCDFKEDYRCEIVHGAGVVIPPVALVTAWMDTDTK